MAGSKFWSDFKLSLHRNCADKGGNMGCHNGFGGFTLKGWVAPIFNLFFALPPLNHHPLQKTFPSINGSRHTTQDLCVSSFRSSQVWAMLCIQKKTREVICGKIREQTNYACRNYTSVQERVGTENKVSSWSHYRLFLELAFFCVDILMWVW